MTSDEKYELEIKTAVDKLTDLIAEHASSIADEFCPDAITDDEWDKLMETGDRVANEIVRRLNEARENGTL